MTTCSILLGILGGQEILIIAVIVLVLFGGKKIPELMRGLGKGVNEYKKAKNEVIDDMNDVKDDLGKQTDAKSDSAKKEDIK
jgi:sec-independent protein translocase protein TatA